MSPWEAHVKGSPDKGCFEIAVIRRSNVFGHSSYGWYHDADKLFITSSGAWTRLPVPECIWRKLIQLAHEVAIELNAEEAQAVREITVDNGRIHEVDI